MAEVVIFMGRSIAPKCMRDECTNTTKRHKGGKHTRFQFGKDGKRYRCYCGNSCASIETYRVTPARTAAAIRVRRATKKGVMMRYSIKKLRRLVKPLGLERSVAEKVVKLAYEWGIVQRKNSRQALKYELMNQQPTERRA